MRFDMKRQVTIAMSLLVVPLLLQGMLNLKVEDQLLLRVGLQLVLLSPL